MAVHVGEAESALRFVVATLCRLLVPYARRLKVDRQGELAELVGLAESKLCVARKDVATPRRLLVPHKRHLDVDLET